MTVERTEATYTDTQIRQAISHGKERYKNTRRYGMVCAEIMEQQQSEIERLRAAIADVRSTAEGAVEWCNATASKTPFAQGQENHARLILEDLKKHGF